MANIPPLLYPQGALVSIVLTDAFVLRYVQMLVLAKRKTREGSPAFL